MKGQLRKFLAQPALFFGTIAVIAGLIGFAGITALNSGKETDSTNCAGICVALGPKVASPDTVTVAKGDFVQFNSADGKTHSLSLGKGGEEHSHNGKFNSGDFKGDEAWRVQFNEDGSFFFHDHYNPKVNVLVVVYTPGKDYKIQ